jgi:hypothetical protein
MIEVRSLIASTAPQRSWSLAGRIRSRSRRSQTSAAMRDSLAAVHADLLLAAGEVGAAETVLSHADHPDATDVVAAAARAALARGDNAHAVVLSSRLINRTELGARVLSGAFLVRAIALPLALVPRAPLEELPGTGESSCGNGSSSSPIPSRAHASAHDCPLEISPFSANSSTPPAFETSLINSMSHPTPSRYKCGRPQTRGREPLRRTRHRCRVSED